MVNDKIKGKAGRPAINKPVRTVQITEEAYKLAEVVRCNETGRAGKPIKQVDFLSDVVTIGLKEIRRTVP